jgi:hypothetical protein
MTLMSELPAGDTHDVIRRGGEVIAVVVPIAEYRQLRQAAEEQQVNDEFDAAQRPGGRCSQPSYLSGRLRLEGRAEPPFSSPDGGEPASPAAPGGDTGLASQIASLTSVTWPTRSRNRS